jgi:hypothetical protein
MLKDSSGYEFDPTVVIAMVAWIDSLAKGLGIAVGGLSVDDLLATCEPLPEQREPAAVLEGTDQHGQTQTSTDRPVHVCL